jgi:hypothetical protein
MTNSAGARPVERMLWTLPEERTEGVVMAFA